jgi:hypothetical protein
MPKSKGRKKSMAVAGGAEPPKKVLSPWRVWQSIWGIVGPIITLIGFKFLITPQITIASI